MRLLLVIVTLWAVAATIVAVAGGLPGPGSTSIRLAVVSRSHVAGVGVLTIVRDQQTRCEYLIGPAGAPTPLMSAAGVTAHGCRNGIE